MSKVKSFHGCFGRNTGDALQSYDFHSNEWTQVRSRMNKEKKESKVLKSLGSWNVAQDACSQVNLFLP
jgi:hypothetical protein